MNSLYTDFEPFELTYGDMILWNGNNHRHCSPSNISNHTHVSFDYRIISDQLGTGMGLTMILMVASSSILIYYMDAMSDNSHWIMNLDKTDMLELNCTIAKSQAV